MTKRSLASQSPRLSLVLVSEGPQPSLRRLVRTMVIASAYRTVSAYLSLTYHQLVLFYEIIDHKAQTMAYGRDQLVFANVGNV